MFKLAWRNLWRNRRRTALALVMVAAGFSFLVLYYAFILGYLVNLQNNLVEAFTGDLQVQHREYLELKPLEHLLARPETLRLQALETPGVRAASGRLLLQGLVSTADFWQNLVLVGIVPEEEREVSSWARHVRPGRFPEKGERRWILLPPKTARRLKVRVGDRVVVMTQARDGTIEARNFHVAGLLRAAGLDQGVAVLHRRDLEHLAHLPPRISALYLRTRPGVTPSEVRQRLEQRLPDSLQVRTWQERYPYFQKILTLSRIGGLLYLSILLLAVALGVLNILYMNVAERYREFGVMMAIGLKPRYLRGMVLLESLYLTTLGILLGALLTLGVWLLWSRYGLNLAAFSQGMEFLGLETRVYPAMDALGVVGSLGLVYLFGLLAGLYPAWRASRLRPVEALRIVR